MTEIARAAPDGQTIGMVNLAPLTIFPSLDRNPPHDVQRDLAQVAMLAASPLVLTTPEHVAVLPDVPTLQELDYDVEVATWCDLTVPAGTPEPIQSRLCAEYTRVAQLPDIQRFLATQGLLYPPNAPDAFSACIPAETRRWGEIIHAHNIRLD